MREYVITPDLGATEEVNVVEIVLREIRARSAAVLEALKAEPPEDEEEAAAAVEMAQKALDAAEAELAAFKPADDHPAVIVGYIHPRKMSSIDNQRYIAWRGGWKPKTATQEQLDALTDISRELVRFGVKGHKNFSFPFVQEKISIGSTEILVVPDELLDAYHASVVLGMRLLQVLADEVMRFNSLAEKKRPASSLPAGTGPVNSTAPSVTMTYGSGEDAPSPPPTP